MLHHPSTRAKGTLTRRDFLRRCCHATVCGAVGGGMLARAVGAERASAGSPFGPGNASGGSLIGIFYDLKQDQQRRPVTADYMQTFAEFIDGGWDEAVLNRFFRVTRPIYATEVFTPHMSAAEGSRAFGVDNIVKPTHWMILFKGQVSPPEEGTYRFVGASDDVMAVAVDGKTVLVSNHSKAKNPTKWVEPEPAAGGRRSTPIRAGNWFTCRKDQIIDLDILIGEWPGGYSCADLTYQKQGVNYPLSTDPEFKNLPSLPVFQLVRHTIAPQEQFVPYTTDAPPWKAYQ